MDIRTKLNLSYVPRWAIVPMTRHQTVSDHSWRVAMIAVELNERIASRLGTRYVDNGALALMALGHDLTEVETGDVPSPNKKTSPIPNPASPTWLIVKAADIIETRTWLQMWGHMSRVVDILDDNDPKWSAVLDAMGREMPGSQHVAVRLVQDIKYGGSHD